MVKRLLSVKGGVQACLLAAGVLSASASVQADMVGAQDSTSTTPAVSTSAGSTEESALSGQQLTPAFTDTVGANPYVLFANSLSSTTAEDRQTHIEAVVFNFDAAHGISPESMPVPLPPSIWLLLWAVILLPIARLRYTDQA